MRRYLWWQPAGASSTEGQITVTEQQLWSWEQPLGLISGLSSSACRSASQLCFSWIVGGGDRETRSRTWGHRAALSMEGTHLGALGQARPTACWSHRWHSSCSCKEEIRKTAHVNTSLISLRAAMWKRTCKVLCRIKMLCTPVTNVLPLRQTLVQPKAACEPSSPLCLTSPATEKSSLSVQEDHYHTPLHVPSISQITQHLSMSRSVLEAVRASSTSIY